MSVNIVQNGELLPIAGKTVPAPTPDYVDEQFNPSTTYSKGMTCIEGNVRYRYKNSTASSGHRPPDTTYWEVLSLSSEVHNNYIDETVFSDFQNFTKPTPYGSRWSTSNAYGGYKIVGNLVYVYLTISSIDKNQFVSGINDFTFSNTFPPSKIRAPLTIVDTSLAFLTAYVYTSGDLSIAGNAQNNSKSITIKGVYEKA